MLKSIMKHLTTLFAILLLTHCGMEKEKTTLIITNNSETKLIDKAVSIQKSLLGEIPGTGLFPLVTNAKGDTLASQLDDSNGDKKWDELFFVADFSAGETRSFYLEWVDAAPEYKKRTSVRFGKRLQKDVAVRPALSEEIGAGETMWGLGFQRYQTDGPTWENDKVGFRHYLDGRNAKDVYGKKIPDISPEDVGLDENNAVVDNYHVMAEWGRDILSVGNSVGLGGYGLITSEGLLRLGIVVGDTINNIEKTNFNILSEGPVRSMLQYSYSGWGEEDRKYDVREITSIWPGMYGFKNSVSFSKLQGDEQMFVGLVNIHTDNQPQELEVNDKYIVLYTHDKQTYDKEWWLGMALILPKDKYQGFTETPEEGQVTHTFLAKLKPENNQAVDYFAVACWELADERFTDKEYFENYLRDLTLQLSADLHIDIK